MLDKISLFFNAFGNPDPRMRTSEEWISILQTVNSFLDRHSPQRSFQTDKYALYFFEKFIIFFGLELTPLDKGKDEAITREFEKILARLLHRFSQWIRFFTAKVHYIHALDAQNIELKIMTSAKQNLEDGSNGLLTFHLDPGGFELVLMSALPKEGNPEERKIYLEKKEGHLRYIVQTANGDIVQDFLAMDISELTQGSLELNKATILKEIFDRGDVHSEQGRALTAIIHISFQKENTTYSMSSKTHTFNEQFQAAINDYLSGNKKLSADIIEQQKRSIINRGIEEFELSIRHTLILLQKAEILFSFCLINALYTQLPFILEETIIPKKTTSIHLNLRQRIMNAYEHLPFKWERSAKTMLDLFPCREISTLHCVVQPLDLSPEQIYLNTLRNLVKQYSIYFKKNDFLLLPEGTPTINRKDSKTISQGINHLSKNSSNVLFHEYLLSRLRILKAIAYYQSLKYDLALQELLQALILHPVMSWPDAGEKPVKMDLDLLLGFRCELISQHRCQNPVSVTAPKTLTGFLDRFKALQSLEKISSDQKRIAKKTLILLFQFFQNGQEPSLEDKNFPFANEYQLLLILQKFKARICELGHEKTNSQEVSHAPKSTPPPRISYLTRALSSYLQLIFYQDSKSAIFFNALQKKIALIQADSLLQTEYPRKKNPIKIKSTAVKPVNSSVETAPVTKQVEAKNDFRLPVAMANQVPSPLPLKKPNAQKRKSHRRRKGKAPLLLEEGSGSQSPRIKTEIVSKPAAIDTVAITPVSTLPLYATRIELDIEEYPDIPILFGFMNQWIKPDLGQLAFKGNGATELYLKKNHLCDLDFCFELNPEISIADVESQISSQWYPALCKTDFLLLQLRIPDLKFSFSLKKSLIDLSVYTQGKEPETDFVHCSAKILCNSGKYYLYSRYPQYEACIKEGKLQACFKTQLLFETDALRLLRALHFVNEHHYTIAPRLGKQLLHYCLKLNTLNFTAVLAKWAQYDQLDFWKAALKYGYCHAVLFNTLKDSIENTAEEDTLIEELWQIRNKADQAQAQSPYPIHPETRTLFLWVLLWQTQASSIDEKPHFYTSPEFKTFSKQKQPCSLPLVKLWDSLQISAMAWCKAAQTQNPVGGTPFWHPLKRPAHALPAAIAPPAVARPQLAQPGSNR